MSAPGPPHDEFRELVEKVHRAQNEAHEAEQRLNEAVGELTAYVKRAEPELTDDQKREADALITVHPAHRRAFHPPPS